jgi:hypothetical protein
MGAALGISPFTIRDAIYAFRNRGWLRTEKWRTGVKSGVLTTMRIAHLPEEKAIIIPGVTPPQSTFIGTSECSSKRTSEWTSVGSSVVPPRPLLDRKIENLSISLSSERISLTWPHLARSGFGPDQLVQIGQALAELGKPTGKVIQSLDHAEWELEHDQMRDKDGQPVADPCSWVFRSLARTGYYRRPRGYVSPEEQAAKDAEAEAKAVTVARHAAEQAQFETWRDGLSPDELAIALRGHPGGPKDAWLKKIWKDRQIVN